MLAPRRMQVCDQRQARATRIAAWLLAAALTLGALACFFRRRLFDTSGVPDLVQETLLRIHRARGTFARGSALMPWVLTVAAANTFRCSPR